MIKQDPKWKIETLIVSYSHELDSKVFEEWNKKHGNGLDMPTLFEKINEQTIKFTFHLPEELNADVYEKSFKVARIWLVSFNIVTLGHTWWYPALWPYKFKIYDVSSGEKVTTKFIAKEKRDWRGDALSYEDLKKTAMLFPVIAKLDEKFFEYYSIATTLLSSPTREHDFYEEISANFYKIIERFIATEIFKTKKASNVDLNKIIEIYKELESSEEMLKEIKDLYRLRGSTIMHSLGKDKPVTFEEAGKYKILADFLLHKHLLKRAEEGLTQIRQENDANKNPTS